MKQPGSNFVSLFGLGALGVLILVAAYFDMPRLEGFLLLCFVLCLGAWLWAKFALRRVEVDIPCGDVCAFPGQSLELDARVHNKKLLPLIWLDLCLPTAQSPCLGPHPEDMAGEEEQQSLDLKAAFLWVMPHQSIKWTQRAMALRRGVCCVKSVSLVSGDGFGLSAKSRRVELEAPLRFVVYPQLLDVEAGPILNNMSEMEAAKNGFYTDRTLLATTRAYREGDPYKNINWRLLARSDEVQVNVYEKLTMHRVCFVPDMYSFTYMGEVEEGTQRVKRRLVDTEALERMFSLVASLIMRLNEKGVLCSLVLPGGEGLEERLVIPESAEGQVMELLTALAEIDYSGQELSLPVERMLLSRHKLGQLYVLSRDMESSVLGSDSLAAEELSAISIVCRAQPEELSDRRVFAESDFIKL